MQRIHNLWLCAALCWLGCQTPEKDLPTPNILWITCEDISPNLGAYGDTYAHTPNLDKLAKEGVLYTNAIASAPVCAVARSSIITGMYASSQGTQYMRCKGQLPEGTQLYPEYLRNAGYFCTNNSKTDYNLALDNKACWDVCTNQAHWRDRPNPDQPFFSIFNFGTSHESRVNDANRYKQAITDLDPKLLKAPGQVPLPPYYPDLDTVRELYSRYYNIITAMDQQVGELLTELETDGLIDNTIIVFYSDHGAGIPRHKRWLYDSGLKVPMIVKVPKRYQHLLPHSPGQATDELVSFIDLPPTLLKLANLPIPDHMQGRAFLGEDLSPERAYVYAGRDRMDERYDMQRAVRSKQFKYIRYYEPYQAFCQYMNTPEKGGIMRAIRQAAEEGSLPEAGQHIVAPSKPTEELFDLQTDPWELNNLANDPKYQSQLEEMRKAHGDWSDRTKDTGLIPETILRKWESEQQQSIYAIMRADNIPVSEIRKIAIGDFQLDEWLTALQHPNAAVRYWAAIRLGNESVTADHITQLKATLADKVPVVRIASARAYCLLGDEKTGLPVLNKALQDENEWVRLASALVLDEIAERARPSLSELQSVMDDTNKYVVRVANHALNNLLGTANVVR